MPKQSGRPPARLIVIEDDVIARVSLEEQLQDAGYEVAAHGTVESALEVLKSRNFDVAICDVRLPGTDGFAFLAEARRVNCEMLVIMLTGYGAVEDAVRAMKMGAADYLCKPVSADEICMRIERSLEYRQADLDRRRLQREVEKLYSYHNLIGHSEAMQEIFGLVELVKDIDSTILIEGDTGTGKDALARAIHFTSVRREHPFVAANCMVLSRELLESELFGHERGAFTGAYRDKPGRFEVAGQGTILLDDVDDIPLDLQGKLVNVLEQRKAERVGSTNQIDLSCRVICATKKNLAELVKAGRFRDDLYYRMNVVNIRVPPLAERKDDIAWLAEHFLELYNKRLGRNVREITPAAMQVLHAYDWPGNVRELEHVIERTIVLSSNEKITPADLPPGIRQQAAEGERYTLHLPAQGKVDLAKLLCDVEAEAIKWAMTLSKGQQVGAAELLNIPRTTLQAKLHKKTQN